MSTDPLVLVIEDSPLQRALLTRQLDEVGFRVVTASGGGDGLADARQLEPDVVLLDLNMPGMDGHEVLAAVRADELLAQVPIVVLTASDSAEDAARVLASGAADIVRKPYEVPVLAARLRMAMVRAGTLNDLRERHEQHAAVSYADEQTGLGDDQAALEELGRLIASARRNERTLSVAHIDVRAVDPARLRALADAVVGVLRTEDVAFRWDAGAFVVLLPETDGGAAERVVDRMCRVLGAAGGAGAAVGWAAWQDEAPDQLVEHAERAQRTTRR